MKKKLELETQSRESAEESHKRLQREMESKVIELEEKTAACEKLDKTKARQQQELEDFILDQDNLRQNVLTLEKKQRKFDQVCMVVSQTPLSLGVLNFEGGRVGWGGGGPWCLCLCLSNKFHRLCPFSGYN